MLNGSVIIFFGNLGTFCHVCVLGKPFCHVWLVLTTFCKFINVIYTFVLFLLFLH